MWKYNHHVFLRMFIIMALIKIAIQSLCCLSVVSSFQTIIQNNNHRCHTNIKLPYCYHSRIQSSSSCPMTTQKLSHLNGWDRLLALTNDNTNTDDHELSTKYYQPFLREPYKSHRCIIPQNCKCCSSSSSLSCISEETKNYDHNARILPKINRNIRLMAVMIAKLVYERLHPVEMWNKKHQYDNHNHHMMILQSSVLGRITKLHNPITYFILLIITGFKYDWCFKSPIYWFVVGFCIKWYRARYVFKIPVWDRQPNWNNIITSKEQEKDLRAYTCKTCGSTLFIAKTREFFFEGDTGFGGLGCFSCGAKGRDNFVMDRERIVEDVGDMDDYFEYERPLDFISRAERRRLLKQTKGDEDMANQILVERATAAAAVSSTTTTTPPSTSPSSETTTNEETVSSETIKDAIIVEEEDASIDHNEVESTINGSINIDDKAVSTKPEDVDTDDTDAITRNGQQQQEDEAIAQEEKQQQSIPKKKKKKKKESITATTTRKTTTLSNEDFDGLDILDMDTF